VTGEARTARVRGLTLALAVALVTIGLDRVTKVWAERNLVAGPCRPGGDECIDLVGSLRLHLIYNPGAAFSKGLGLGPLFGVVAAVMTVVLLRLAATSTDRVRVVLFGLIAGGAVGNLIDRVVRAESGFLSGSVIDFIDLQWWPVFNVADAAVVCGVIAFLVWSMRADLTAGGSGDGPDGEARGSGDGPDGAVGGEAGADGTGAAEPGVAAGPEAGESSTESAEGSLGRS